MKKILAIILAAVLVLSFAACKKNDINNDTTASDAQISGQAADISASDETDSSEEASSEVETEVVTDKAGHTVIETKASQSSDTKTTTNGNYTTITFNVKVRLRAQRLITAAVPSAILSRTSRVLLTSLTPLRADI